MAACFLTSDNILGNVYCLISIKDIGSEPHRFVRTLLQIKQQVTVRHLRRVFIGVKDKSGIIRRYLSGQIFDLGGVSGILEYHDIVTV